RSQIFSSDRLQAQPNELLVQFRHVESRRRRDLDADRASVGREVDEHSTAETFRTGTSISAPARQVVVGRKCLPVPVRDLEVGVLHDRSTRYAVMTTKVLLVSSGSTITSHGRDSCVVSTTQRPGS